MDLYPDFQNVLTLLNKLAKNREEQQAFAMEFRRQWESGDMVAAMWLGNKLSQLAQRHSPQG